MIISAVIPATTNSDNAINGFIQIRNIPITKHVSPSEKMLEYPSKTDTTFTMSPFTPRMISALFVCKKNVYGRFMYEDNIFTFNSFSNRFLYLLW
ncbi:hypothetical protein IMSAGC022_00330 [Alistipes sp.]|nr:hypothetical protein IMSAGC022_00330 [Alistipes sp.]